jgi:hypothetical protein
MQECLLFITDQKDWNTLQTKSTQWQWLWLMR